MIDEIDEALLGSLKKGLADLVPADSIVLGPADPKKKGVSLVNTGFTIDEPGMGVSELLNEELEEKFDATGQAAGYLLKGSPVKEILQVESPKGTFRIATDDYTFDRVKNLLTFREPPKKGKDAVRIKYALDKPLGESRLLKFALVYTITVNGKDLKDRDKITLAAIETLYRDVGDLFLHGVEDLRFNKGYTAGADDGSARSSVLEYTVTASRRIDVRYPTIAQVDLKRLPPK